MSDADTVPELKPAGSTTRRARPTLRTSALRKNFKSTPLFDAIDKGDVDEVSTILTNMPENAVNVLTKGTSALHQAVKAPSHQLTFVEILLMSGADPSVRDSFGRTCLHVAAKHGVVDVAKKLLDEDVFPDPEDNDANTPLHVACSESKPDIAALLLKHNDIVKIDSQTATDGKTPLLLAVEENCVEAAKLLLEAGASPHIPTKSVKRYPLHIAIQTGNINLIELLMDYGADADARNADGQTCLEIALASGKRVVSNVVRKKRESRLQEAENKNPSESEKEAEIAAQAVASLAVSVN
eukprot:GFYU01007213.1.p1 GENE.GFYU01007213.1~~GFYU01007213.1.p1  ORF type:complete len:297 (+),score=57.57 GFYU01007213.1:135-1025(+)